VSIRPSTRALPAVAVLLLAAALSGCDLFGPSGPGTLEASVRAEEPLGGVVLELVGEGITGFVGRGDTRAVGRTISLAEGRHRVVVVAPEASPIRFGIEVEDLGADPPSVLVVSAVDPSNRPSNARGIRIEVE
jgi:hypothetical protein